MTMLQAIERNRHRAKRYERAERVLRSIRQRIFDYEDRADGSFERAQRVMATCKRILTPLWETRARTAENRRLQNYMM
jgi:hypothetical protein